MCRRVAELGRQPQLGYLGGRGVSGQAAANPRSAVLRCDQSALRTHRRFLLTPLQRGSDRDRELPDGTIRSESRWTLASIEVDLGVDRGGGQIAVPQHLADVGERHSLGQHLAIQGVTQPMRPTGASPARRQSRLTTSRARSE